MEINADFGQRIIINTEQLKWLDSPMLGVSRRPLDRVGDEVARATSLVRYAPNSNFSPHTHTGGEEIIVLEGVFQDEHGDFPAGSYIRNPPTSKHRPGSEHGCIIFVKLWQFDPHDRVHVRLNSKLMQTIPHNHLPGVRVASLYNDNVEDVAIFDLDAHISLELPTNNGAEIFVLEGELTEGPDTLVKHSWLRVPIDSKLAIHTGATGAKIWIKQGHLRRVSSEVLHMQSAY